MSIALKRRINSWSQKAVETMEDCTNEQQVKHALVLPFFRELGYDVLSPNQVISELNAGAGHGRVDYALKLDGEIRILVECKPLGAKLIDEVGQLGRYFNAIRTADIGILTNGIYFKCFTFGDRHTMEHNPFIVIDLKKIAQRGPTERELDILKSLQKADFDSEKIAELARLKRISDRLHYWWLDQLRSPSDELCRLALRDQGLTNLHARSIEIFRPMVSASCIEEIGRKIKADWQSGAFDSAPVDVNPDDPRIITTKRELEVYDECRRRLAYLSNGKLDYHHINKIHYRDYVNKFVVHYKGVRKGRMFDFYESNNGGPEKFAFPDGSEFESIEAIDEALLSIFRQRVYELGEH